MKLEIHIDCGQGLTFKRPSLVKAHFADECDLGKIVQRFTRTGELPNLKVKQPLNIDATQLPEDYAALQQMRVDVSNAFEQESDEIKELCQHNVELYAEYLALSDEERSRLILKGSDDSRPGVKPPSEPPVEPPAAS